MGRKIFAALVLTLVVGSYGVALAECTTETYMIGDKIIICSRCCTEGGCTTICT
jgi:hypothetical protein